MTWTVREASAQDAHDLAVLKWLWSFDRAPMHAPTVDEFAEQLADWMASRHDHLTCVVAEVDGAVVGMAWMAIYERVPNIEDLERLTGDIQSVFVMPEHRGSGLGTAMTQRLLAIADERGLRRVTVHSGPRAMSLYGRLGFKDDEHLRLRPGKLRG